MSLLLKYRAVGLLMLGGLSWNAAAREGWPAAQALSWRSEQVKEVTTFGLTGGALQRGKISQVDGRACLEGGDLHFRVDESFAFDVNERIDLAIQFELGDHEARLRVAYDGVASPSELEQIELPARSTGQRWYRHTVSLKSARFAHLGYEGSDFSITAADPRARFTICDLTLRRSHTTPAPGPLGTAVIKVLDDHGETTPARVGLYDESGRLLLPGDEALLLRNRRVGVHRVIELNGASTALPPWPVKNRSAFYIGGRYRTQLPAGKYEVVVAKGPEYRITRRPLTVTADRITTVEIALTRWKDMAADGWYSSDTHMHYPRSSERDDALLQQLARAEDLKVANILTFGNSVSDYLTPYSWTPSVWGPVHAPLLLVPGQEDPRTFLLGHTVGLNIQKPVRDPTRYLLYDTALQSMRAQGGLAGYVHVVDRPDFAAFYDPRGLAIDVPLGLVDFVEIMMPGTTGLSTWFDFLNLGYKLTPTAGTDWPYGGVAGAVRNYVHVDRPLTRQAWFDALKQGRTFVTSGPMLEFRVNGMGMGAEVRTKRGANLVIDARATVNPDFGPLASLELIEQGEVVKQAASSDGSLELKLHQKRTVSNGTWFVIRAIGKERDVIAVSAPIYVLVEEQTFQKSAAVPTIVARLQDKIRSIFSADPIDPNEENESPWPSATGNRQAQLEALEQRADRAIAAYDRLETRR